MPVTVAKALGHLRAADPLLSAVIERVGPMRLPRLQGATPYDVLARAIVGQQISGHAARAILAKIRGGLGGVHFPAPEAVLSTSFERLRALGLSGGKALSLKDLAEKTTTGVVPDRRTLARMPEEEVMVRLTAVRGVGPWTVQMLLLFYLRRPDVFPITDLGIQKGFGRVFLRDRLPSPKQMLARGERWRPYRSVASWYLWRALELAKPG